VVKQELRVLVTLKNVINMSEWVLTRLIGACAGHPAAGLRVQLVHLVVLDGRTAIVLGPFPL
jgi:hypothetical protein